MMRPERRVLLSDDDPADAIEGGPQMQFRLTYEGKLLASQPGDASHSNGDRKRNHKHELRQHFHHQLRRLWNITPFLNTGESSGPELEGYTQTRMPKLVDRDRLARIHNHFGFGFVPLVTKELHLLCGLDILLLRPDPMQDIRSGDIDNRAKTIIDALSIPDANQRYDLLTQDAEYKPFYVLLENDKLVTKISVETDQLLDRSMPQSDNADARVLISIHLRGNYIRYNPDLQVVSLASA